EQLDDGPGQQAEDEQAQSESGLRDGAAVGGGAGRVGLQAFEQDAEAVGGQEPHADDEPDGQPQRQARAVARVAPGLGQGALNDAHGDDTLQGSDTLLGGLLLQRTNRQTRGHESLLGGWWFEQTHFARRLSPCPCPTYTYAHINVCRSERYCGLPGL